MSCQAIESLRLPKTTTYIHAYIHTVVEVLEFRQALVTGMTWGRRQAIKEVKCDAYIKG